MTELELKQLCAEWQKILGLAHWNIETQYCRYGNMVASGNGCCSWHTPNERALIQICDPVDYELHNDSFWPHDIETTIVHELLHIVFNNLEGREDGSIIDILHEQAIDRTARALVRLKRGNTNFTTADIAPEPLMNDIWKIGKVQIIPASSAEEGDAS